MSIFEIIDDTHIRLASGRIRSSLQYLKIAALQRDRYTCQDCGAEGEHFGRRQLHVHHVVPVLIGGQHCLSNLITLCAKCHKRRHSDETLARIPPARRRSIPIDTCVYYRAMTSAKALGISTVEFVEFAINAQLKMEAA